MRDISVLPNRFITLEGGEGTGKTTQRSKLVNYLESIDIPVISTREPGGSPGGEAIRQLLVTGDQDRWDSLTETLLFHAARRDHLIRRIWPALEAGQWVISDRFSDSTMAYQGYGDELGYAHSSQQRNIIEMLHQLVVGNFEPDLTLILDLPPEVGLARARQRFVETGGCEDRFEGKALEFHHRLRAGFLDIARRAPQRCVIIDANRDPDQVHQAILQAIESRLGLPDSSGPTQ